MSPRVTLMARMDRLQDDISAIRDDALVNMRRADRTEDRANAVDERVTILAGEVTAMQRQIQRLQSKVRELRGGG
jgi:uncharacterized coiled-coil DUF342 family protein